MTPRDLSALLRRDLATFIALLDRYEDEALLWRDAPAARNPPGTLALHVTGNLRHFVGAVLGDTGYVRDRDREFTARDVPRAELQAGLRVAMDEVAATLDRMEPDALDREYPLELPPGRLRTGLFLMHLCTHLAYHLGQADEHRRRVAEDGEAIRAMSIPADPAGDRP